MTKAKKQRQDVQQIVTDTIIEALSANVLPWRKPWKGSTPSFQLAKNVKSKKHYNGINILLLGIAQQNAGYESNLWGTYKQWQELGGQVMKGEKSTLVVFYKTWEKKEKDENGNETILKLPVLRQFRVFNIAQIEGCEDLRPEPVEDDKPVNIWERYEEADRLIEGSGAEINHVRGNRAFYSIGTDTITLPESDQFESAEGYYSTAFHEIAHWTGASHRLDRKFGHNFGDEKYAFEELIAELTAAFTLTHVGLPNRSEEMPSHVSYLSSWLKSLKNDKTFIHKAAAAASKATEMIMNPKESLVESK
jgi:antirestriction protein ArdC